LCSQLLNLAMLRKFRRIVEPHRYKLAADLQGAAALLVGLWAAARRPRSSGR